MHGNSKILTKIPKISAKELALGTVRTHLARTVEIWFTGANHGPNRSCGSLRDALLTNVMVPRNEQHQERR